VTRKIQMGLWLKQSAARGPFGRNRSIGKYDIKMYINY
jgi:hypothetical protein